MAPLASFGKYLLTDKLATGGMAEIYRGKLLGPGGFEKLLVIKQIHPELARHQQFVEMFVAEAKTTVSLSHGNIVPVYELGVVDGTYFIAMEFVDGVTLTELFTGARTADRRLTPPEACYVVSEILKGLDYAHRKSGGIIHRDLSTRNVMVSRDGEVKILDFGLAATLEGAAAASAATSGGGRPVGSFPYMSPEQAARAPIDPRTDLFTCGILLWEMLTGRGLFVRATDEETIAAVRRAEVPPPSSIVPDVPPELERACLRALELDPARRFPDAGAFLGALGRYLHRIEPAVTPSQIATLVATVCPPRVVVPLARVFTGDDDGDDEGTHGPALGGPATRPMEGRGPTSAKSFATHVVLTQIMARDPDRTPARAAGAPPASPRRSTRLLVLGGAVLAIVAGIAITRIVSDRKAAAHVPAPDAAAPGAIVQPDGPTATHVAPPDAATAAAAPIDAPPRVAVPVVPQRPVPDAAVGPRVPGTATPPAVPDAARAAVVDPRPPRPVGEGTLRLGLRGAPWATVELGGRRIGRAPLETRVPAGRHDVTVTCDPEVCPPLGVTRTIVIDVPIGGLAREVVDLAAVPAPR